MNYKLAGITDGTHSVKLVGVTGFEPVISCPPDKRLTGLGHTPI